MYSLRLRTRTADRDYFWIGDAPNEWWTVGWGSSMLRRSSACALRKADSSGAELFLTGIGSSRRDASASHTRIRYELLFREDSAGVVEDGVTDEVLGRWWDERLKADTDEWNLGSTVDSAVRAVAEATGRTSDQVLLDGDVDAISAALASMIEPRTRTARNVTYVARPWVGAQNPEADEIRAAGGPFAYFRSADRRGVSADHLKIAEHVPVIVEGEAGAGDPRPKAPSPPLKPSARSRRERSARNLTLVMLLLVSTMFILVMTALLF